jgi:hypothetical protein
VVLPPPAPPPPLPVVVEAVVVDDVDPPELDDVDVVEVDARPPDPVVPPLPFIGALFVSSPPHESSWEIVTPVPTTATTPFRKVFRSNFMRVLLAKTRGHGWTHHGADEGRPPAQIRSNRSDENKPCALEVNESLCRRNRDHGAHGQQLNATLAGPLTGTAVQPSVASGIDVP